MSTSDIPKNSETTMATLADDTALLFLHEDPVVASDNTFSVQSFFKVELWMKTWRIKSEFN